MEHVLNGPDLMPRYYPTGPAAVDIVNAHVQQMLELAITSRGDALRAHGQISRAIEWLAKASEAGLLQDCCAAALAAMEEEWCICETRIEEVLAQRTDST